MDAQGQRRWGGAAAVAVAGLLLACDPSLLSAPEPGGRGAATPREARSEPAADGAEQVRVAYPRGSCPTGLIEVQIHRDGDWQPHPRHPRVRAGDVHWERADSLLALRVRCIDPRGGGRTSLWVTGVRLSGPSSAAAPGAAAPAAP